MLEEDSQNVEVQVYNNKFQDPGPESDDSTPSAFEAFVVLVRRLGMPSARLVRPVVAIPSSNGQPSQVTSTLVTTIVCWLFLTSGKFAYRDLDSYRNMSVDMPVKKECSFLGYLGQRGGGGGGGLLPSQLMAH